jgi:membrane protein DedA with SNARE-associated domain
MEEIIRQLQSLDPLLVYGILFSIAFVENIFPPSPSDMVIVFGGTLVGLGHVGFVEALVSSTVGSTLGFMAMYGVGDWFGLKILERGRIKFIPVETVRKVESWFARYGYWIIVANRFLAGTRAVVSFFAGMSRLTLLRTTVLCFLSACAWNCILLTGGYSLGHNWERIGFYLTTYSEIVTAIVIVVALGMATRYFYVKRNGRDKE